MKVLHVTNLYPTTKNTTYGIFVKEQIDALKDNKMESYYFINAKEKGLKSYIKAFVALRSIVKPFDIIHCHHQFSVIPLIFSRKKIILSVLGDIKKRSFVNRFVFNIVKHKCKKIIFKNYLPNLNSKYYLLPNGVNTDVFFKSSRYEARSILNLDQEKNYILFVSNGSLSNPIKRKDKFDEILTILNKDKIKFHELILSNISRDQVIHYYNAANLMLVTSDHEGSPNAVKEAMSCSLPIVSTPVGDVQKNLKDVTNSFVSDNFNTKDLVELVKKISLNEESNSRDIIFDLKLDLSSKVNELKYLYKLVYEES
ncbi:MAG: glycosyltransferase family 4 protein [Crocinitomicaceae bacterium]